FGVQSCMWMPFGTYRNAARSGLFATGAAVATGDIASSQGRATAAPSPLSMVRRGMGRAMRARLLESGSRRGRASRGEAGRRAGQLRGILIGSIAFLVQIHPESALLFRRPISAPALLKWITFGHGDDHC